MSPGHMKPNQRLPLVRYQLESRTSASSAASISSSISNSSGVVLRRRAGEGRGSGSPQSTCGEQGRGGGSIDRRGPFSSIYVLQNYLEGAEVGSGDAIGSWQLVRR